MNQQTIERLIRGYQAGVQHPEVSGMEHLQLLQVRSKLADILHELSKVEQAQIAQADQILLANANAFWEAINEIADLDAWRIQGNIPHDHWWWYLDIIVHLPVNYIKNTAQTMVVQPALA